MKVAFSIHSEILEFEENEPEGGFAS